MANIKKFTPIHVLDIFDLRYKSDFTASVISASVLLYTLVIGHVFTGIILSYLDKDLYYTFTKEDGYIEYFTAIWLLATSLLCLYKIQSITHVAPKVFLYTATVIFFLGFGEEISWGQRIFGFETPENLERINAQKEFNLHNIHLDGVNLNKIIFGKLLYTGVFIYFIGFTLAYHYSVWFKRLVDKVQIPIPTPVQSILYTFSFICILIIKEGEKWELQEFALAGFIFLSFLFPLNKPSTNSN